MPGKPVLAGIDIGTSRIKLYLYDQNGEIIEKKTSSSPLKWERGEATHDPVRLHDQLKQLINYSMKRKVEAIGISLYRASIATWKPGGTPTGPIILWLDRKIHREARKKLPKIGKIAGKLPIYNKLLAEYSPLPVIAMLHQSKGKETRVWTLDALIHEWIGAGYRSEPTGASLTGIINPRNLKPVPLIKLLAGIRNMELPAIQSNILEKAYNGVAAIISDQQSAMVGVGCMDKACLKLSLGTGFFADKPVEGPPPLISVKGVIPIVIYKTDRETLWGQESYTPGAGLGIEGITEAMGGFQQLHQITPEKCRNWEGGLLLPYPSGRGAGIGADRLILTGNPTIRGKEDLACSIIAGIVTVALHLSTIHKGDIEKVILTGSLAKIPIIHQLISNLTPWKTLLCSEDPTPRGAAILAGKLVGIELPPMNCEEINGSGTGFKKIVVNIRKILTGNPAKRKIEYNMEEIRRTILETIKNLE